MKVEIRLFAGLTCRNEGLPCFGAREFELEVPDGTSSLDLPGILNIATGIPLMTVINNQHDREGRTLAAGDSIAIFPPIGGG